MARDRTGERYGALVIQEVQRLDAKHYTARVICDCGNEKWVRVDNLVSGATGSCGCTAYVGIKRMTAREKWFALQGFKAGYLAGDPTYPEDPQAAGEYWLDTCVADDVTVVMVLEKYAPRGKSK